MEKTRSISDPLIRGKSQICFELFDNFNYTISLFAGESLKLKIDYVNLGFSVGVTVCLRQGFLGGTNRYRCIRHITSPPLTTFVIFSSTQSLKCRIDRDNDCDNRFMFSIIINNWRKNVTSKTILCVVSMW